MPFMRTTNWEHGITLAAGKNCIAVLVEAAVHISPVLAPELGFARRSESSRETNAWALVAGSVVEEWSAGFGT
jgi:hypothetical protein